jgi:riboflavin kinase/FMN adenylyltransferase
MKIFESIQSITPPEQKTCVALGLFDGLHVGHKAVIGGAVELARSMGRPSAVFTFSLCDEHHPAAKSGSEQLFTRETQAALLETMGVDSMLRPPFADVRELSAKQFIEEILVWKLYAGDVFCGENYRFGKGASGTVEELKRLCEPFGITVHTFPLVTVDGEPVSSTRIRACIASGDMQTAAKLLGRSFAIDFEVIPGRKLGRTLDSPTINQPLPPWFVTPRFGVYASLATVGGKSYPSVSNVGLKPTVGSDHPLSETYIQGFDGDLYGQRVPVEFLEFIRPEVKFGSIDELKAQIHKDSVVAREICLRYN